MPNPYESPIRVSIALIGRGGRYLIRRRRPGEIMAGVWEFPGGKSEPGEDPADAAARESLEEVGLPVVVVGLRDRFAHRYPHGLVELSYYDCQTVDPGAEPDPSTGFRWVEARDLHGYEFPGANGPIVAALASEAGRVDPGPDERA